MVWKTENVSESNYTNPRIKNSSSIAQIKHILIRNFNYNHYMWKRQILMIIVIISR